MGLSIVLGYDREIINEKKTNNYEKFNDKKEYPKGISFGIKSLDIKVHVFGLELLELQFFHPLY